VQSSYRYLTTFYPLWSGVADAAKAAAVERHLSDFERNGGLATSTVASGTQWDLPYGWAPLQWLTVVGLQRFGFNVDARRIAGEFTHTVAQNYARDSTIREKYDVVSGSANIAVAAGYKANVVGFGWTNGVYLRLLQVLSGEPSTEIRGWGSSIPDNGSARPVSVHDERAIGRD